jgi:hypothetical protein
VTLRHRLGRSTSQQSPSPLPADEEHPPLEAPTAGAGAAAEVLAASATGGPTGGRSAYTTVMVTELLALAPASSVTVSRNVRAVVAATRGATKLGRAVEAPARAAGGPSTCDQE